MSDVLGDYATSHELDAYIHLDIEEMISLLSPFDVPFLGTYNGLENTPVPSILPSGTVTQVKYDWQHDELLLPRATLSAAYTAGGGTFTLSSGEGANFQPDDLVRVETASGYAHYRVTAVDYDADTIDIVLWDGTDANVADGELVEGVGTLPREGGDPPAARATDRTGDWNVTQIFGPYPVEMSETEQVVSKYGVPSEWAHQSAKRVKEAALAQEQAIIYGVRKISPTEKRRSMGGINYFIDEAAGSTVDSTTTSLAGTAGEAALLATQQAAYEKGGDPRMLTVGPANKPDISGWRKTDIRYQQTEQRRGTVVTTFESDFGIVDMVMHRWVRAKDAFVFNHEQAEVETLIGRNLKWVKTAKTGDRDQAYIICEKGFKFRRPSHAAKFTNLGG